MIFHSPTRNPRVREDSEGSGKFMADRGNRLHRGLDLLVCPGDIIMSPIAGKVLRKAYPYASDMQWQGILITNKFYWIKIFYMIPDEDVIGQMVRPCQVIGKAQDISLKYGYKMTPHIHLQVAIPPMESIDHRGAIIGNEIFINPEPLCLSGQ